MKINSLPKILVALFVACLLSYVFVACKDVETTPLQEQATQQTKEITVENGRLKFVDEKHFRETFDDLMKNQNAKYLGDWEGKFENYVSMKAACNNLTEIDKIKIAESKSSAGYEGFLTIVPDGNDLEAIRNTEHPIHSLLFNKEGIMLIGKHAYKLEFGRILKINNYNLNKIDNVLQGILSTDVQITSLKSIKTATLDRNSRIKGIDDLDRSCHDVYGNNRAYTAYFNLFGDLAINLFGNIDFGGAFSGYFAIAKHRKRFAGVWFNDDAPSLRLNGQFLYYNGISNQLINLDTGYCSDCSELAGGYFWGGDYSVIGGWVQSSGTGDDGNFHGCSASK